MIWNKSKSILLSKACVIIFALSGAGLCAIMPWAANVFINYSSANLDGKYIHILISFYALAVPAFAVLYLLYKLLRNIQQDKVFVNENTVLLRRISWLCISVGILCFIFAWVFISALIIGAMAAFMGLIIRVLKNVFAQAVSIKEENDFTI